MRRGFDAATRLTMAVLLGGGMLVAPGSGTGPAVARSTDCPSRPLIHGR